jgi:hypothetical protein
MNGELFINAPSVTFYLKRDCHHKYEWLNVTVGQLDPFALQPFGDNAVGFPIYIGRKVFGDSVAYINSIPLANMAGYADASGNHFVTEYQVLTCKSRVFETPPETTTVAPGSDDEVLDPNYTGCGE